MTEVEGKRITTLLVAAYPSWKPGEATMQLYERLLSPLDAKLVEEAVLRIIRTPRDFAPPVGAIFHEAARLVLLGDESEMTPEEAWAKVAAAVRSHGCYRQPRFANRALARTVAALNWGELCTNPNIEATRAHFFRLFGAFQERRIAGRIEQLSSATAAAQMVNGQMTGLIAQGRSRGVTALNRRQGEFRWNPAS